MTGLESIVDRARRHAENAPRVFHLRWARYYRFLAHHYNRAGSSILAQRNFNFEARHFELARARQ